LARYIHQLLKLYLRPNHRNTFDGRPLRMAAERGGLIKKKSKESL